MAGTTLITDPNSAYKAVTDWRLFRDANGLPIEYGKGDMYTARANATVSKGDALEHVVPTAAIPYSVQRMAVASGIHLFAGVALNSAVAGGTVNFMHSGFFIVSTDDSDTPAFGQVLLKPDATAGQFATAAAAATLQNVLGTVLGAEEGGAGVRQAPAFVNPACGISNAAS